MKVDYSTISDIGSRSVNEDYVLVAEKSPYYAFILCDGLGGHAGGNVASRLAAQTVYDDFMDCREISEFLDNSFEKAQQAVKKAAEAYGNHQMMRTTMVILVIRPGQCTVLHSGDSRLYRFRNGEQISRTRDHSVPQMLALTGEIEESEIRFHPDRNQLLSSLGDEDSHFRYERHDYDIMESDVFLLCSDGFWEPITERDMITTLSNHTQPKAWLEDMMQIYEAWKEKGTQDNCSAIAVMIKG